MNRYLINQNNTEEIIKFLTKNYSLPVIKSCMVIYSSDDKYIFELVFRNNVPYFRFFKNNNLNSSIEHDDELGKFPHIELPVEGLKFFLKMIGKLGFRDVMINESVRFEFLMEGVIKFILQKGTLLGDILYVSDDLNIKDRSFIFSKISTEPLDRNSINEILEKKDIKTEPLYTAHGSVNSKIQNFSSKQGINLSLSPSTISFKLGSKSNDFTVSDKNFESVTGKSIIDSAMLSDISDDLLEGVSIVVSSFNSEKTLPKVLEAINSQKINPGNFHKIEVIVIDDGSEVPVINTLKDFCGEYKFILKVIRFEQNLGLSTARNSGVGLSSYENLILIDSDILLSENYIKEALVRLQTVPNALYFALKQNIDSEKFDIKIIKNGLQVPATYDDKRLNRHFSVDMNWINKVAVSGDFEILGETDNLKLFGNGRVLNGFDLPSAVVGHNMVVKKSFLQKVGGFGNVFNGWGLEDTFFGAKFISSGNFIIPLLSTGVYHINHPPRSGSEENKQKEYDENLIKYEELINKEI
jgi:glycosyltransferase involved in cell wall biosynthesis